MDNKAASTLQTAPASKTAEAVSIVNNNNNNNNNITTKIATTNGIKENNSNNITTTATTNSSSTSIVVTNTSSTGFDITSPSSTTLGANKNSEVSEINFMSGLFVVIHSFHIIVLSLLMFKRLNECWYFFYTSILIY